ncbi:murein hydrolase activator EnvC family protein [Shewanella gelidii]|uniref:murein hydrolase activator EnvC family protein n=1 Tax=Shewanella gelidii TaxID=1642821 RepID=UPI001663CFB5|nr:peptidoglycan DD-metalloendopeptidase family protein [Shewanella gelidii]MCL1098966.1 peptidoglycan DD-metalloendopeptidase family protein [Shewanella gelidii]
MSTLRVYKASIVAGFLLLSIMLSFAVQGKSLEERRSALKSIQAQISQQRQALNDTSKQRKKLLSLLKHDEQAIAKAAKKINQLKGQLAASKKKLQQLNQESLRLEKLEASQQKTLAKQLSSAYLAGNHDYTKMLLNQQNPSTIERMLTYYQYLNKARMKALTQLKETQSDIKAVTQSTIETQNKLNAAVLEQQKQAKKLSDEKAQRQKTQVQLQRTLTSKNEALEQLQIEEASLKRIVKQALESAKDNPQLVGLSSYRGKLAWPTRGRIRNSFGSSRSGRVKWKGISMSAPEGQNVYAIADGKVIYADWLKGFGMVIVIDHGRGYMSLYGHAQALLRSSGDIVRKREPIALVGLSGGLSHPSLYFEIRHKGQAVDPAKYCRRK